MASDESTEGDMYDLIIVGFGPAGAAAANLAGAYGLRTLVVERDVEVFPRQRAMAMDDEALRIIRTLGLYDEATEHMHRGIGLRFTGVGGREFMSGWSEVTEACGESQANFFHQPWLERELRNGLNRWSTVEVRAGWESGVLAQDDDVVSLEVLEIGSGERHTVCGKYLLACDGGSSAIRKQLGVSFDGSSYSEQWIDVQATPKRPLHSSPMFEFVCDPARPGVNAPCAAGHHRWEWRVNPGESAEELLRPDSMWKLLAASGVGPDDIEVTRTWSYTFHVRKCARWRVGRVLLAGDAAHVMPPFAGQGISGAFRDVMNVTWKIAAVVGGRADEALLDSYQTEREPHHDQATASAVTIGRIVLVSNKYLARLRDLAFRGARRFPVFERAVRNAMSKTHPLQGGYLDYRSASGVEGNLLKAVTVARPGIRMSHVDEALGIGWAVIGLDADPRVEIPADVLAAWDGFDPTYLTVRPGSSVVADGELGDPAGLLWEWMNRHGVKFMAVRPDRYVYTASAEAGRFAPPALAKPTGRLHGVDVAQ